MAHQQNLTTSSVPPIPDMALHGNATEPGTEVIEATSTAASWIGVIMILCMLVPAVISISLRQHLQAVIDEESEEEGEQSSGVKVKTKQIHLNLLDKFKVTLNESNFCSVADDTSTNCSLSPSGFLSVDKGNGDCAVVESPESPPIGVAGTKDTDDDSILDLEQGSNRINLSITAAGHETRIVEGLCAICLSVYKVDETIVYLHSCGHTFHYACMRQVILRVWDSKCPLCRQDLLQSRSDATEGLEGGNASTEARSQEETTASAEDEMEA